MDRPRAAGHASFNASGPASDLGDPYRIEKAISVSGRDVPPPITSFGSAGFTGEILKEVRVLHTANDRHHSDSLPS